MRSIDLVSDTFKLSAGERRQLLSSEKGEGLLFALGARIAIRVEASRDEHALATTDPREVGHIQVTADLRAAGASMAAVEKTSLPRPLVPQVSTLSESYQFKTNSLR